MLLFMLLAYPLLVVLSFVLFMRLCRDLIHAITKRSESRPTGTQTDDTELRELIERR